MSESMSRVCPQCDGKLPGEAAFCPRDGTRVVGTGTFTAPGATSGQWEATVARGRGQDAMSRCLLFAVACMLLVAPPAAAALRGVRLYEHGEYARLARRWRMSCARPSSPRRSAARPGCASPPGCCASGAEESAGIQLEELALTNPSRRSIRHLPAGLRHAAPPSNPGSVWPRGPRPPSLPHRRRLRPPRRRLPLARRRSSSAASPPVSGCTRASSTSVRCSRCSAPRKWPAPRMRT